MFYLTTHSTHFIYGYMASVGSKGGNGLFQHILVTTSLRYFAVMFVPDPSPTSGPSFFPDDVLRSTFSSRSPTTRQVHTQLKTQSCIHVTDKPTSTEGIRTTDPRFECPSALPTELMGKFPLATASRRTLYQYCYIMCQLIP